MCTGVFRRKKSLVKLQAAVVQYGPYVRYVSVEKQRSFAMHVAKSETFFFSDRLVVETIVSISVMKKQQT